MRKIDKHTKQKRTTKRVRHGAYFCISFIRTTSIFSVISALLILSIFSQHIISSDRYVLGASTSPYSCAWWNVICAFQNIFHFHAETHITVTSGNANPTTNQDQNQVLNDIPSPTPTTLLPGYQEKTDIVFHFSLQYPSDWFRSAELPSYFKDDNGGITPYPTGTPELQHSFGLHSPNICPPAQKVNGGYKLTAEDVACSQKETSFNFVIEPNPQHLSVVDFINTFELPSIMQLTGYGWTVVPRIYTQQYGKNTATVLETTRTNKGLNIVQKGISGIYFSNKDDIFKFNMLPGSDNDPAWTTINTIISTLTFE